MSIEDIERNLEKIRENLVTNEVKIMWDVVFDLMGKSQRIAPHETGNLAGSASPSVKVENSEVIGEVGFNESYALEQHENLYYTHEPGKTAKYLEGPLMKNADKYKKALTEAARKGIKL